MLYDENKRAAVLKNFRDVARPLFITIQSISEESAGFGRDITMEDKIDIHEGRYIIKVSEKNGCTCNVIICMDNRKIFVLGPVRHNTISIGRFGKISNTKIRNACSRISLTLNQHYGHKQPYQVSL